MYVFKNAFRMICVANSPAEAHVCLLSLQTAGTPVSGRRMAMRHLPSLWPCAGGASLDGPDSVS